MKFVKAIQQHLIQMFQIARSNPTYYEYLQIPLNDISQMQDILLALPPNTSKDDKHVYLIYDDDQLVAMLDLITNYPNAKEAWIGYLMIHGDVHRQKWGNRIVSEIEIQLKKHDYHKIGLAVLVQNKEGLAFWEQCGFQFVRDSEGIEHTLKVYTKNI